MKTPGLNLHELLRRLGRNRAPQQFDLSETVVPIALVSDLSQLVAPINAPTGMGGFKPVTTVGNSPAARLTSVAKGGTFILHWSFTPAADCNLVYRVALNLPVLTTENLVAWHPAVAPVAPITSVGGIGDVLGNLFSPTQAPNVGCKAGIPFFGPALYVPAGYSFGAFTTTVSIDAAWSLIIRDCPATNPPL